MRITTIIKLSNDLELEIEGYYDKGQTATYNYPIENSLDNVASKFEISDVKIIKGTFLDFIYTIDDKQFIIDYLEKLTLKQIEENEYI